MIRNVMLVIVCVVVGMLGVGCGEERVDSEGKRVEGRGDVAGRAALPPPSADKCEDAWGTTNDAYECCDQGGYVVDALFYDDNGKFSAAHATSNKSAIPSYLTLTDSSISLISAGNDAGLSGSPSAFVFCYKVGSAPTKFGGGSFAVFATSSELEWSTIRHACYSSAGVASGPTEGHVDGDNDGDGDGDNDEDGAADSPARYCSADIDGDGLDDFATISNDCADSDDTRHSGATEEPGDEIDSDCDGKENCYHDEDGDTYLDLSEKLIISDDTNCDDIVYDEYGAEDGLEATASQLPTTSTDCDSDHDCDCNDSSNIIHPGAAELCDGDDNDCDGRTDEDPTDAPTWYPDDDGDHCSPYSGDNDIAACSAPGASYYSADQLESYTDGGIHCDCADSNPLRNDNELEVCDASNVDEDCDGDKDDEDSDTLDSDKTSYYQDGDSDDYGNATAAEERFCDNPDDTDGDGVEEASERHDYADNAGDCDDSSPSVYPGATETTGDGVDQDCSGQDNCNLDLDCDGHLVASPSPEASSSSVCATSADPTSVTSTITPGACLLDDEAPKDDCDDSDATVFTGATDYWYDGINSNCDEADDCNRDGDPYTCPPTICASCWDATTDTAVSGCVVDCPTTGTDCDDNDDTVGPGSVEECNGRDDNCDNQIDEPYYAGTTTREACDSVADDAGYQNYYLDQDGDGYYSLDSDQACLCSLNSVVGTVAACGALGYYYDYECWALFDTSRDEDCNDSNVDQHPVEAADTFEEIRNGLDDDCDNRFAVIELDQDLDGYVSWPADASLGTIEDVTSIVGEGYTIQDCRSLVGATACIGTNGSTCRDYEQLSGQKLQVFDVNVDLYCSLETGLVVVRVSDLESTGYFDNSGATNNASTVPGDRDCDDRCLSRNPNTDEFCDGVDNDCDAVAFEDADSDGIPNSLDQDESPAGFVNLDEFDADGDGELACKEGMDPNLSSDQTEVATAACGNEPTTGDCNPVCALSSSSESEARCDGIIETVCDAAEPDPDRDGDDDRHTACGYLPDNDQSSNDVVVEDIYVLVYVGGGESALPLVLPRDGALREEGQDWSGCDLALADAQVTALEAAEGTYSASYQDHDALLDALPGMGEDEELFGVEPGADPLLALCVDQTLNMASGGVYTGACAVVKITLGEASDIGLSEYEDEDCDWWETDDRTVWSRSRILESRRRVMEWECFRMWGTFGCGGDDVPNVGDAIMAEDAQVGLVAAPTFNEDDPDTSAPVYRLYDENEVGYRELGRYSFEASGAATVAGCWKGLADRNDDIDSSARSQLTGGDCDAHEDSSEGEDRANRDQPEGPGDPVHIFNNYGQPDHEAYDCDECFDGIDNNCNGVADAEDPYCERCFSGQGCASESGDSGCSVDSQHGRQRVAASALLVALLGLATATRRRRSA